MSEKTFSIEFSKSGRSACKKCKEHIAKDEMRVGQHTHQDEDKVFTVWNHLSCFTVPKQFKSKANKMSTEDFVKDMIEDTTNGQILPAKLEEVVAALDSKGGTKDSGGGDALAPLVPIIQAFEKEQQEIADGQEPSHKKAKSLLTAQVDAYTAYYKCKGTELADMLSWNHQVKTGTKKVALMKVIDGHVHGRLARCPLCTGRLKLTLECTEVLCNGAFDESVGQRLDCSYTTSPEEAPRWMPWYSSEPSDKEKEEMLAMIDEITEENTSASEEDVALLQKAASKLEWNLASKTGLKTAVGAVLALLQNHAGKTVDLPSDEGQARQKVGQIVAMHRDKTVEEVIPLLVRELGFREDKAAKAAKKEAAVGSVTAHPANGPAIAALKELGELYFKEGNRNAGGSYSKAVKVLMAVDFEITEDNAKGLGSGKKKLAGIGKGTADKLYEFCTTGSITKLEEKRALNA